MKEIDGPVIAIRTKQSLVAASTTREFEEVPPIFTNLTKYACFNGFFSENDKGFIKEMVAVCHKFVK